MCTCIKLGYSVFMITFVLVELLVREITGLVSIGVALQTIGHQWRIFRAVTTRHTTLYPAFLLANSMPLSNQSCFSPDCAGCC